MTQLALRTAIVLLIALAALALWQMREAAQLLAVAVAVAAALSPLVERLTARGVGRPQAAAIVFGGGIVAVMLALAAYGSLAAVELAALVEGLPIWYLRARQTLSDMGGWAAALAEALPSNTAITGAMLGGESEMGMTLLGALAGALAAVVLVISVASLGFYWLVEEQRFTRLWLSLLPLGARTRVRTVWGEIAREIGIYVRGTVAIVAITTLGLLSAYSLAGVPGAALLALAGGLAQIVPLLGPPLAVLPGAIVGLAQGELTGALALIGGVFVVSVVRLVIQPMLYRDGIVVNPVLVVAVIMALAELGGPPLVLLGPPLAAALQASTRALLRREREAAARPRADRIGDLAERLEELAERIDPDDDDATRLQGMVERARRLLAEARGA